MLAVINTDSKIYDMDLSGKSIFDIPCDSTALTQVKNVINKLNL